MNAIRAENLVKKYGAITAVNGISLAIPKGEIFGLLGPNGAGKTTTILMLATLLKPTSGRAFVNGHDVVQNPQGVRSSIGMVFQDPSSDPVLTGYENLKLHALMYDVPWREIDTKIDAVLELVDLKDRKNDIVKKYSGGMRRRMEIARGLLHEPQILFLDEPTIGLDPQTRTHIWDYIRALAKRLGMTIILTTHYMEEAEELCDRVAIIDHGCIVALDSPLNLKEQLGGDLVLLEGNVNVDALRGLDFVTRIEKKEHVTHLTVNHSAKNLPALLRLAGDVTSIEVRAPNLNDVFLHHTGRAMRDNA